MSRKGGDSSRSSRTVANSGIHDTLLYRLSFLILILFTMEFPINDFGYVTLIEDSVINGDISSGYMDDKYS